MSVRIRTLFLSDLHLGSRHCRADQLLALLNRFEPEAIYLVGDAIDGRELTHRWRWPAVYNQILARFSELNDRGTELFYTPGNHDEFMRQLLIHVPAKFLTSSIKIAPEFVHITADGKRLLVIHGDQFDNHECHCGLVSKLTAFIYDKLLHADRWLRWTGYSSSRYDNTLSSWLKKRLGKLQLFFHEYKEKLSAHAITRQMDGILCGHIHQPMLDATGKALYLNTGDWLEHCSAIIEEDNGHLKLIFSDDLSNSPDDDQFQPARNATMSPTKPDFEAV